MKLWLGALRKPIHWKKLNGCYSNVIFGMQYQQRPIQDGHPRDYLRDPVLMSHMSAFAARQRYVYGTEVSPSHRCRIILARHIRMPNYIWDFAWHNFSGISRVHSACIKKVDMATQSVQKQLTLILTA